MIGLPSIVSANNQVNIVRNPADVPKPLKCSNTPTKRTFHLEAVELDGYIDGKKTYRYWTFNGKVPGPLFRACVGDTIEIFLKNASKNTMIHSVDFHAVTGPGGGYAYTKDTAPGEQKSFTFKALKPGLFVYHCATHMVAHHISQGMYGLFLIEPTGGLPPVDREFYVMQGEIYAEHPPSGSRLEFSYDKLMNEHPTYIVFNGAKGALTDRFPLKAKVGEKIRLFFGVGGPNLTSSFHVIGEIFDEIYNLASLTSPPLKDVQTTLVPPGGAVVADIQLQVPGRYILVDHALSRMEKGLAGHLIVEGKENPSVYKKGTADDD